MKKLFASLLLSCCVVSQGLADDSTNTVAAFGDSLFAGYGLPPQDSFPAQLEAKLKADGYNVTVLNDGVSGDTSAGGASRIESVIAQKPTVVLLEFGGNDLLRAVPPAETRKNLQAMLARLQTARVKIVLIGLKAPVTMGIEYASAFNAMYSDLASAYGARLYPFFLEGVYGHPELMQPDGVHPTRDGVAIMVGNVYPYVSELLRK